MFEPNTRVSHYIIKDEIGSGGMGIVYLAKDLNLDREVAIKAFTPTLDIDDTGRQRFFQEARAISQMDHPNLCTVHEVEETEDGKIFMVMSFYPGGTLTERMEEGRISQSKALELAQQIGKGLAYAHSKNIIHRDIKPGNIMFSNDGTVKIVDFGIAKLSDQPPLTSPGQVLGTIAYMSPEQAEGDEVNHQTDIWAFGVVLYEMLAGKQPFEGNTEQQVYEAIIKDEPRRLSEVDPTVPKTLEAIVHKALKKELEDRYATVQDMLDDLIRYSKNDVESISVSQVTTRPQSEKQMSFFEKMISILRK